MFGYCDVYGVTPDVNFTYENCQWKCEISNVITETKIEVRCSLCVPGKVSVSSAGEVPCVDANLAKYDLNDTDLNDDEGSPHTKYWCYDSVKAHEVYHRINWQNIYEEELNTAISVCEAITVVIDRRDPDTTTCWGAYNLNIGEINARFDEAWDNARNRMDDPNTRVDEAEVRAYMVSYAFEHPISVALPGGCGP